jgi:hypothetical protein
VVENNWAQVRLRIASTCSELSPSPIIYLPWRFGVIIAGDFGSLCLACAVYRLGWVLEQIDKGISRGLKTQWVVLVGIQSWSQCKRIPSTSRWQLGWSCRPFCAKRKVKGLADDRSITRWTIKLPTVVNGTFSVFFDRYVDEVLTQVVTTDPVNKILNCA